MCPLPQNDPVPHAVTPKLLRRWPLPVPEEGDKEARGRVLVVGGAPEMPGAVILAANAALRAGAGKLQIATCKSIAPYVGIAVPEALVVALAQSPSGALALQAADDLVERTRDAGALVIGPGLVFDDDTPALMQGVIRAAAATVVLDAAALKVLKVLPDLLRGANGISVLTPHAGEMAGLLNVDKREILDDPLGSVRRAATTFSAVIVLKGSRTYIGVPGGEVYCNKSGNVGLATSGSGDVLAGIIGGLAARGSSAVEACAWGVFLHARAGDRLAQRTGTLGFLARELLAEIPAIMAELSSMHPRRKKAR